MCEQAIAKRLNEISKVLEGFDVFEDQLLRSMHETKDVLVSIAEILAERTIQEVIRPEDVDDYLRAGWKYVDSFSNSRDTFVVVEIDEKERR